VAPDKQVEVTMDRCPDCGAELGSPFRIDSKIVEEIPEPQPIMVTEYKIARNYSATQSNLYFPSDTS